MLKNVSLYLILLFLVCLPLDHFYSEVALIALTGHTMLLARREDWEKFLDRRVLALQSLFGVILLATLYSPYKALALQDVFQALPLFLCPWLCAVLQPVLIANRDRIFGGLCLSCVAVLLYLYGDALYAIHYFHLPLRELFSDHFVNQQFTEPLGVHATYLSMYCALSLFWCIRRGLVARRPLLYFCGALLLSFGLVQLSAKCVWVVLVIMGAVVFPYYLTSSRQRIYAFAAAGVAALILGIVLLQSGFFHKRMIDDFSRDLVANKTVNVENQSRMVRWGAAWSLIRSAPVAGYGWGTERPLLQDAYFRQGLYEPYLLGLNAHNQFLHWWITTGLLGLLVYTGLLGAALYTAFRARDLLWTGFLLLVIVVSLVENILDVQQGLFFVSFFFPFFFFSKRTLYGR
ncbi:O-antigen ligase family protein [Dinghuibacter silviterrae]|uniref:O-antigen ligase n=1 Tax=Dinghuibacter silviterrae TaxID=1539049 RepID=A0A4R8DHM3_9BACT|nr:O-antigen ligase family protein [Dinghuibacter silviterrae]TDW96616.1 O-antigen ligase [Dinghuibacter silviterrae]